MSSLPPKINLSKRLVQVIIATVIAVLVLLSLSLGGSSRLTPSLKATVTEYEIKAPVNDEVTYILYFEPLLSTNAEVSEKVLDDFVFKYTEFVQRNLDAELGHGFDSVLKGFTFKLPSLAAIRENLMEFFPSTAHSSDLVSLLYQYLTAYSEKQLKASQVELHLEKDQTLTVLADSK